MKNKFKKSFLCVFLAISICGSFLYISAYGPTQNYSIDNNISISNVFSNNMVLQQDMQVSIWGWGPVNEKVELSASWGQSAVVNAGNDRKWLAKIQTPKAIPGKAPKYTLTIKGKNNTIVLENILIGDVWLCSGQSNMEYVMAPVPPWTNGILNYEEEIANANYPNIRLFKVPRNPQSKEVSNCGGTWLECNSNNVKDFSAVAYFFGRELYKNPNINIPIGLLLTSHGASTCESWTRRDALATDQELKTIYLNPYDANPSAGSPETRPTMLYNGMISPLVPYGLKGAIWYQGESNVNKTETYAKLWSAMIKDWRKTWGIGDFPVYYVQLPGYSDQSWPKFRDMQYSLLSVPNTGMAVTIDVGEQNNIHPINKKPVGERLALWAIAKTYKQDIVFSGPIYKSSYVQNNKIIISFYKKTIGYGLRSKDNSALREFEIAGWDKKFYPAEAYIDGENVVVYSSNVSNPQFVRYGYKPYFEPNLINSEGLPAAPFSSDTWNYSEAYNVF